MIFRNYLLFSVIFLLFGCSSFNNRTVNNNLVNYTVKVNFSVNDPINRRVVNGHGSGSWIETKDKINSYILTNRHVCRGNFDFKIESITEKYNGQIFAISDTSDLCILKVIDIKKKGLKLSETPPEIGDLIFYMGFPLDSSFYNASGYIGGKIDIKGLWMNGTIISTPVTGGSSGSPVVNHNMELVGVVFATIIGFNNCGFSVNYEDIKAFLSSIDFK